MIHNDLRDAALAYARAGWAVLPIEPQAKAPVLIRSGEGHKRASTDPAVVARQWDRWPEANVAIATGPSGLLVVDLDGPEGVDAWEAMVPAGKSRWPRTPAVRTPRGWHLYFAHDHCHDPLPSPVGGEGRRLPRGVDVRAAAAYVIAPPSIVGGRRYRWANRCGQLPPVPAVPGWLVEKLRPPERRAAPGRSGVEVSDRYLRAAIDSGEERVRTARDGARNDTLRDETWSLLRLVALDSPEAAAIRDALTAAALANPDPLEPSAIAATIRSAFNGRARQRQP